MRRNLGIGQTMDDYKLIEKDYLTQFGHTNLRLTDTTIGGIWKWGRAQEGTGVIGQIFPAYARDDGDCFKLMQQYGIWVMKDKYLVGNIRHDIVVAWWEAPDGYNERVFTPLDDHRDTGYAYRYAAVLAAVSKLKQYKTAALAETNQRTT